MEKQLTADNYLVRRYVIYKWFKYMCAFLSASFKVMIFSENMVAQDPCALYVWHKMSRSQ